jgi:acylaminoacyl-peptidase
MIRFCALAIGAFALGASALTNPAHADPLRARPTHFVAADVFNLEAADNPQIAPDGRRVAYVRVSADIMTDRFRRSIWMVDEDGRNHRPLVQGPGNYSSPVWSRDGRAIAYTASENGRDELRVYYLDTQRSATLTRLQSSAGNIVWSPDGRTLAFQMFVDEDNPKPAPLPEKPEGAQWNAPAEVINSLIYRIDGEGYVHNGYVQIFVLPADGGTPRQLTYQARNHDGRMSWTADGRHLIFSANAEEGWEYQPVESDIYSLNVADGQIAHLTSRRGREDDPDLSPDGRRLAYVGFDDHEQGYQVTELYVANANGTGGHSITAGFDRDIQRPTWVGNGSIYFLFVDHGVTKLGRVSASGGQVSTLLSNVGGTDLGRPYTTGAFSVNQGGRYAANVSNPRTPGDVFIGSGNSGRRVTALNEDLFTGKQIGDAEHIEVRSSADGRPVDAWIVRPPDFDASRKYPLLLEIHGGPYASYGPQFAAEIQLYAAAGYVVVYSNPRGSTSYGGQFGNAINHDYPSHDYDDLMSVVDATIAHEPIDAHRLYVTGGSGGGVLTAWIVGTTNRFAAAMVQKPVINWTSFALTSDFYNMFSRYWFGVMPWEPGAQQLYWEHSPLSRVGNVTTPTGVLGGEDDHRTPPSEAEQFYQALRLRHIDTELVRIPGASHEIAARPTGLIEKVTNTLAWFAAHGGPPVPDPNGAPAHADHAQ